MKWIVRNGLLLYIILIFLTGLFLAIFEEKINLSSSIWTILLLSYFLLLSIYIGVGQRNAKRTNDKAHETEKTPFE
ncbi:hypothetical protein CVD25_00345 [Bacillus canaveralius]|uniref:Uncharacterized protein n=1 Tax=Bacillus canaveralius TaxID=1403243 RepID=A0A2N5GQB3_9BACI|nr:hypothetical protein [Bacillus canaveralius]PLR85071.1 hypothetical protein CU635_04640 [Bacillus canaveralius]PLS00931.1 hypothetical protein CVD25_00345 [Bacillus canaveralius]RSK54203.1 hypothetical protein EJA13_06420 [Bacillus canaveralius]